MAIDKNLAKKIIKSLPEDPASRLMAWNDIKELLDDVKKIEASLRKELLESYFAAREEGTTTVELGHEWKVRCKQSCTRSIDKKKIDDVMKLIPASIRKTLVKFEPKLVVAEYRKLSPEVKAIFDDALTLKNGSATLELVPPKTVEL